MFGIFTVYRQNPQRKITELKISALKELVLIQIPMSLLLTGVPALRGWTEITRSRIWEIHHSVNLLANLCQIRDSIIWIFSTPFEMAHQISGNADYAANWKRNFIDRSIKHWRTNFLLYYDWLFLIHSMFIYLPASII